MVYLPRSTCDLWHISFQSSVKFYIETNHLTFRENQTTSFYNKWNSGLWNGWSYYCLLWKRLRYYTKQSTNLTVRISKWIKSLGDLTSEICISRRNPHEVSIVVVSSHLKFCFVAANKVFTFHSKFMTLISSFHFSY